MKTQIFLHYTDDLPGLSLVRDIERLALADRRSLHYCFGEPGDPRKLIKHHDVSHILETDEDYQDFYNRSLQGTFEKRWSGTTMCLPDGDHMMLINPAHSRTRRTFTIGHEFGHLVFQHNPIYVSENGMFSSRYNDDQERDANYYALAFILPYAPLVQIIRQGATTRGIAYHYTISTAAVEMRIKTAGLWDFYQSLLLTNQSKYMYPSLPDNPFPPRIPAMPQ